jgi:tRNA(Arg) A34 adenosine deaminase TadA
MCLAAAYWAKLKRIVYGADHNDAAAIGFADAFIYSELALDKDSRSLQMQQVMPQEARDGLRLWLDLEQKILY